MSLADSIALLIISIVGFCLSFVVIGCGDGSNRSGDPTNPVAANSGDPDRVAKEFAKRLPTSEELRPMMESARSHARKMQSGTQVRGIQQGMVTFASGNGAFYPGLNSQGENKAAITASQTQYGAAAPTQSDQSITYAIMLTNAFFTPDYAISPAETDATKKPAGPVTQSNTVSHANYSYALLQWADATKDVGRRSEWNSTENSMCPAVSDRAQTIDRALQTASIHAPGAWQGNVAWNDNHVTFETTHLRPGQMVKVGIYVGKAGTFDDLFSVASPGPNVPEVGNIKMAYRD